MGVGGGIRRLPEVVDGAGGKTPRMSAGPHFLGAFGRQERGFGLDMRALGPECKSTNFLNLGEIPTPLFPSPYPLPPAC